MERDQHGRPAANDTYLTSNTTDFKIHQVVPGSSLSPVQAYQFTSTGQGYSKLSANKHHSISQKKHSLCNVVAGLVKCNKPVHQVKQAIARVYLHLYYHFQHGITEVDIWISWSLHHCKSPYLLFTCYEKLRILFWIICTIKIINALKYPD